MKDEDVVTPIGLKLTGKDCLVVGSGSETWARAAALARAGARVRVVSERPPPELLEAAQRGAILLESRGFVESDLDRVWLAVLADRDDALAERMERATALRRVFFCAVDQPRHSSFSHMAIARSAELVVAISTTGRAPALARRLREELERVLGEADLPRFIRRLSALREQTPAAERKQRLNDAVSGVRLTGGLSLPDDLDR